MERKEFEFNGTVLNGFLMLFVTLALTVVSIVGAIYGIVLLSEEDGSGVRGGLLLVMQALWSAQIKKAAANPII